jgi:hypothetical protein
MDETKDRGFPKGDFRPSVQQWLSLDLLTTENRVSWSLTRVHPDESGV